jgi:hypothetical protein
MTLEQMPDADPATLTKEQANIAFSTLVQQLQREQRSDIISAWAAAKRLKPALFARAFPNDPPVVSRVQVTRLDSASAAPAPPLASSPYSPPSGAGRKGLGTAIPNDATLDELGLPRDASYAEFRAAATANAGASPRDSLAIWNALIGVMVASGVSAEAATAAAEKRFPELFADVSAVGNPDEASRMAFLASASASGKDEHASAATAHEKAAAAREKAGDPEKAEAHRALAKFHTGQAGRLAAK